ncbi:FAD-dependent 2-octaprenylphenol hydroxylase [Salinivibrio proteolyticus]|uniref:FAD-dependent 2-octaprenylphenol hydroxylase n=1 Tax=Salinivibrio proteolyticus TaxID=334715 RepID=UPI000988A037|nr:FAD-dependent 2-octaprenylphenol hydroxylase [Salinivibrio proteolyticus]OOF31418.1 FAD-dependent 2-octaprenylphenol hydroxylase [Salinivibrio proteolyticus]
MKMINADIAIIGGGMVGLTLAAALEHSALRVVVIEGKTPEPSLDTIPDNRVSALSRASERILRGVGAWSGIESRRMASYQAMHVWEQDSFAEIAFDAQSLGQRDLGHIVENRVIQLALLDKIKQQSNVTLLMPEQCQSMMMGERETWLQLASGGGVTAKLVVGADGARSWVRGQASLPLVQRDYGHHAVVATVRTEVAHQGVARQIFTPDGPLAFLPLSDPHLCSIVWSVSPCLAQHYMDMDDAAFNQALTAQFDVTLGLCEAVGPRASYPLTMRYAQQFAADRVALVGDAAHTIHPLAGQGVNLGLLDAAALAETLIHLAEQEKDIGLHASLRNYERWRKAEAAQMIAAMQGFRSLFDGAHPIKKLIRGVGMQAVNHLSGAKLPFIKRALGLSGELPKLACATFSESSS